MIRIGVIILLVLTLGIAGGAQACIEMRCPTCPADSSVDRPAPSVDDEHDCCKAPKDEQQKPREHQSNDHPFMKICCSGACAMILEFSATTVREIVIAAVDVTPTFATSLDSQPTTPPPRV